MNRFFKGVLGAVAVMGASLPVAQAQDYIFTFSLGFYTTFTWDTPDPGLNESGNEGVGAGATGSFTISQVAPSVYSVTSWSINTTAGEGGSNPAAFEVFYSSANLDDFAYTDDDLAASVTFAGTGDMTLTLTWDAGTLLNAIAGNVPTTFDLNSGGSYEYKPQDAGNRLRLSGYCSTEDDPCESALFGSVSMTPPQIEPQPTATPEPASMALLGAGLLGLFAARRRRVA